MPFNKGKWSLHLFYTGKTGERLVVTPIVAVLAVAAMIVGATGSVQLSTRRYGARSRLR
jgi:hypothetical protein